MILGPLVDRTLARECDLVVTAFAEHGPSPVMLGHIEPRSRAAALFEALSFAAFPLARANEILLYGSEAAIERRDDRRRRKIERGEAARAAAAALQEREAAETLGRPD